jgi:hypothetical protein
MKFTSPDIGYRKMPEKTYLLDPVAGDPEEPSRCAVFACETFEKCQLKAVFGAVF